MLELSVVIITKNEAKNIVACVRSAKTLTDDIILVDAESEDATANLARNEGCKVISLRWNGYGNARNTGAAAAKNNWILALDADERITTLFANKLHYKFVDDSSMIYGFGRRNFFGGVAIKHGELGRDKVWRLYNRRIAQWDTSPVHEKLTGNFQNRKYLGVLIDHYTIQNPVHYKEKRIAYAYLCALKYLQEGRRSNYVKEVFASPFNFIKSYLFLLGFLDGKNGLSVAKIHAYYTKLKYQHLHEFTKGRKIITQAGSPSTFSISLHSSLN